MNARCECCQGPLDRDPPGLCDRCCAEIDADHREMYAMTLTAMQVKTIRRALLDARQTFPVQLSVKLDEALRILPEIGQ